MTGLVSKSQRRRSLLVVKSRSFQHLIEQGDEPDADHSSDDSIMD